MVTVPKLIHPSWAADERYTVCPRCGVGYPARMPGHSRTDDETAICGPCAGIEALEEMAFGRCLPQSHWQYGDGVPNWSSVDSERRDRSPTT